jgi:hypothetical protein
VKVMWSVVEVNSMYVRGDGGHRDRGVGGGWGSPYRPSPDDRTPTHRHTAWDRPYSAI